MAIAAIRGVQHRSKMGCVKCFIVPMLVVATAATIPCVAQLAKPVASFASITVENDWFAGTDRHYTSGLQGALLVDIEVLPEWLRSVPPFEWSADAQFVGAFGQRIFTPSDRERSVPIAGDRRYAGWIYALSDVRTRSGAVIDHFTLNLGIVGPASGARQTQNTFHRLIGSGEARGWESQIPDQATLMAGYERAWLGLLSSPLGERSFDFTPRISAALGNVLTYASAGAVLRYGSNLPSDVPVTHISLGPARDGYRGADRFGWYVWTGTEARAVARNIFIDTNWTRDGPGIHRKPYGLDLELGAALTMPAARVGFALVQRSREFWEQDKPDRYGQLTVAFAY